MPPAPAFAASTPDSSVELALRLLALGDFTTAFAVRAFSALGIADCMGPEPRPLAALAANSGMQPAALGRLLVALSSVGLTAQPAPDQFALAPAGELLRTDHPFSMRDAYRLPRSEILAWTEFVHCVRTGRSAFEHVHDVDHRRYRGLHAEEDERMDRVHRASSRIEVAALVRLYEWSRVRSVVDVGGGTGMFLAGLLATFEEMTGVLFDLPRMTARVGSAFVDAGVQARCEIVGGDFFESVPAGGDVYVLKAVVGGWDDASVVRILRTVRAAMRADSKVLVIEPILDFETGFTVGNIVQLQSMLLYGGPERTMEDYTRLSLEAGLRVSRVIRRATLPILELVIA